MVHRQNTKGHAQDTVELAQLVGSAQTLSIGDLGELLALDDQTTHIKGVDGLEARHRARAIHNVERGTVGNVSGGLGGVVLGVATAGAVALRRGNPKISTASVKDHVELLLTGTKSDLTIVLRVLIVVNHDGAVVLQSEAGPKQQQRIINLIIDGKILLKNLKENNIKFYKISTTYANIYTNINEKSYFMPLAARAMI